MYDVIYAVVACGAMLVIILIAMFAYSMNAKWTEVVNKQNNLLEKMNHEWAEAYARLVELKTKEKRE